MARFCNNIDWESFLWPEDILHKLMPGWRLSKDSSSAHSVLTYTDLSTLSRAAVSSQTFFWVIAPLPPTSTSLVPQKTSLTLCTTPFPSPLPALERGGEVQMPEYCQFWGTTGLKWIRSCEHEENWRLSWQHSYRFSTEQEDYEK